MPKKTVIDVGNCPPDHASIRRLLTSRFDATVLQTHGADDTLELLERQPVDLILINRKLDQDYSDGIEVLKRIKSEARWQPIPIMIVTNFAEHQDAAVELGALRGFGKLELQAPTTQERLAQVLA